MEDFTTHCAYFGPAKTLGERGKVLFSWYSSHMYEVFRTQLICPLHLTGALANSEDPDEMPLNVAAHQGPHCPPKQAICNHGISDAPSE